MMDNNRQKTIVWVLVAVVALIVVACIGYLVWKKVQNDTTPIQTQTLAEQAEEAKRSGIKAEATGKNQQALEYYQSALKAYKQDGDKNGAEDMGYKVEFMKQAIAEDKKATEDAIKNGDKPTSDEWL